MLLNSGEIRESLKEIKDSITEVIRELRSALNDTNEKISRLIEENVKITTTLFGGDGKDGYHEHLIRVERRVECLERHSIELDNEQRTTEKILAEIKEEMTSSLEKQNRLERLSWVTFGVLISVIFGPGIISSLTYWGHKYSDPPQDIPRIEIPSPLE